MTVSKPIIFLDIDGVLNFAEFRNWRGMNVLSKECVLALFWLLEKTGANIVISSTWRCGHVSLDSFKKSFHPCLEHAEMPAAASHLILDRMIGMTLDFDDFNRWKEIEEWVSSNEFTGRWAILDDDPEIIGNHENFFPTSDDSVGLTFDIAERVAKHLMRKDD